MKLSKNLIFCYGNRIVIRLINLSPISLFSTFKLATSSGKHWDGLSYAYIVSLLCKLVTSAKDTYDLSIEFDRSRDGRQEERPNNKINEGKYHVKIRI